MKVSTTAYDAILVGAGIINLLEATRLAAFGHKVLILERSWQDGGAWQSVDLDGWTNVENAVHYMLPDERAEPFLEKFLGVETTRNRPKFLVRVKPGQVPKLLPFRSVLTKFVFLRIYWLRSRDSASGRQPIRGLRSHIRRFQALIRDRSWYPAGGSVCLLEEVRRAVKFHNVPIRFQHEVREVVVLADQVVVKTSSKEFVCAQVVFSHGLRNIRIRFGEIDSEWIEFPNKGTWRPQVLLLVNDPSVVRTAEFVVFGDPWIKYVHEVSCYASAPSQQRGEQERILAVALHPGSNQLELPVDFLLSRLMHLGICSERGVALSSQWNHAEIPDVDYEVVEQFARQSQGRIKVLATENMSKALGEMSERWPTGLVY